MTIFVTTMFILNIISVVLALFGVAVKQDPKGRFISMFQAVFAGGISIWAAILLFA